MQIEQALELIINPTPQVGVYEQFTTNKGTRIHSYSFALPGLSHAEKLSFTRSLSQLIADLGVGLVETVGAGIFGPTAPIELQKWYNILELEKRPRPPVRVVELDSDDALGLHINQGARDRYEQASLIYGAEMIITYNQSRIYLDSFFQSDPMLFLTNSDLLNLQKALGQNTRPER